MRADQETYLEIQTSFTDYFSILELKVTVSDKYKYQKHPESPLLSASHCHTSTLHLSGKW